MSNLTFTPRLYKYIELPLRQRILSQVDCALVEYEPMRQYLANRITDMAVHAFTPIIFEGKTRSNDGRWIVTIPGHIDPRRRNYSAVANTFDNHLTDYVSDIEIRLLGRPAGKEGREIIDRFDELANKGWKIKHYTDWISVSEFNQNLRESDLILSPMCRTKRVSPVVERYGVTKASGCFGDALRYGNPLLLPSYYPVPPEVKPIVREYSSEVDLGKKLIRTLHEKGLTDKQLDYIAQEYSIDAQRAQLYGIFDDLLQINSSVVDS